MNERAIFVEALEHDVPADRAAFLDEACAGDPALRARVEALLGFHERAGDFPGKLGPQRLADELAAEPETGDTRSGPAPGAGNEDLGFLSASDQPGSLGRLGHYEIQEVVGRGGMGIVLRAFDAKLHRVVAIKVMAAQLATSATARKRFTREAQAAAAVSHDHVITIFAVEDRSDLPYLVMQFVDGVSLQDRLDRSGPLPLAEVLRIGMQVAAGLAAAHAQGLVHRDVKPANILLENGVQRVKLTDFGLARAADDASLTQSGVVAGTPAYMSPEQARGEGVDRRSDLFSLGSVLYAMCTGRRPFRAGNSMAVLKRVCEETPTPVREVNADVPEWLVAVIGKLHAKDPADRFQSAGEVADVLGRRLAELQHPSVVPLPAAEKPAPAAPAQQPPVWRRHRWVAAAAVLVLATAGLGLTEGSGVTKIRSTVIRIFTPDGTLVVEVDDPGVKVTVEGDGGLVITGAGAQEVRLRPGSYTVRATKDGKAVGEKELITITRGDKRVVRVSHLAAPAAVLPPAEIGSLVGHLGPVQFLALSPDGKVLASCATDHTIRLWNPESNKLIHKLEGHTDVVSVVAFSPDGKVVASGSFDHTVKWWDVASGKLLGTFEGHTAAVWRVVFAPDGKNLFTASADATLRRVDLASGQDKVLVTFAKGVRTLARHDGTLAAGTWGDSLVHLWDVNKEEEKGSVQIAGEVAEALAFDPKGQWLAEGGYDTPFLALYEVSGKLKFTLKGNQRPVLGVAFSPDGRWLLSVGGHWRRPDLPGEFKVWDTATGKQLANLETGPGCVYAVVVAADGKTCFTAHHDGSIRKWRLPAPRAK